MTWNRNRPSQGGSLYPHKVDARPTTSNGSRMEVVEDKEWVRNSDEVQRHNLRALAVSLEKSKETNLGTALDAIKKGMAAGRKALEEDLSKPTTFRQLAIGDWFLWSIDDDSSHTLSGPKEKTNGNSYQVRLSGATLCPEPTCKVVKIPNPTAPVLFKDLPDGAVFTLHSWGDSTERARKVSPTFAQSLGPHYKGIISELHPENQVMPADLRPNQACFFSEFKTGEGFVFANIKVEQPRSHHEGYKTSGNDGTFFRNGIRVFNFTSDQEVIRLD